MSSVGSHILRIHNAGHSTATPDAARVPKPQAGIFVHGVYSYQAQLRGPGVECRLLEVTFCEYTMQGAPPPHPTLLVFQNLKQAYAATVFIATLRNSEDLGLNVVCWKSHFANTQCRALHRRTRRCPCSKTSIKRMRSRCP